MKAQRILRQQELDRVRPVIEAVWANHGSICGGFARHLASPNADSTAGDIDIYPQSEEHLKLLQNTILELQKTSGLYANLGRPTNYNGVQCQRGTWKTADNKYVALNLIHLFGDPWDIINDFDFTVCQAYLDYRNELIYTSDDWEHHETNRMIRLTKASRVYLPYRLIKYMEKGYMPDYETIVTFMSHMDDNVGRPTYGDKDEEWAAWLAAVYQHLQEDNPTLANNVATLGDLINSSIFRGGHFNL